MFGRIGRQTAITIAAGVLLAACSASVAPTTSPPSGQATTGPSAGSSFAPSAGPVTSPVAPSSPAAGAGSPGPGESAGDIDPCSLLTPADLTRLNGETYGPGVSHTSAKARLCVWQNSSGSMTIELAEGGADRYAAGKASLQSEGFSLKDIPTVADAAFIARHASPSSTGGIYVQDGDTLFNIVYLHGTVPTDGQLTVAALEVVGQLP